MKRFIIILLLLLPSAVNAVAYTSAGDGDWDNAATWGGGGVPGVGDTATIRAGDTVTIDDNLDVGTSPGNLTTYDTDILGTLIVSPTEAQDISVIFRSSVRIQNGGTFSVGTAGTRVTCDYYRIITMRTATGQKYIIRVEDGSTLIARGCEGFPADEATNEYRARITACAPNCNAGAARVLTLDTVVSWARPPAIVNPITVGGTGNPQVIIGSGGGTTDPGADLSEIAEITDVPGVDQIEVTLANNHQIGDIVVNTTRNVLFNSSTPPTQGRIYSNGGSYNISWVAIDNMGDAAATPSIDFDDTGKNFGILSYLAITNCEDGGGVDCTTLSGDTWTTLEHVTAYNFGAGDGIDITSNPDATANTANGMISMKGAIGIRTTSSGYPISFDTPWVNGVETGLIGSFAEITNALFHWCEDLHMDSPDLYSYYARLVPIVSDSEFYHTDTDNSIETDAYTGWYKDNKFLDAADNCIDIATTSSVDFYFEGNTYDNCNDTDINNQGAIYIDADAGHIYMQAEDFGSSTVNKKSNILWKPAESTTLTAGGMRLTCNECILNTPAVPLQTTPIHIANYTNFTDRAYMGLQTYVTTHNKDAVAGDHWGFGPGGMSFERETVIVVDNTLNLKMTPYAADSFRYFKIGQIHVNSGQTLTVNVQIRKDEAQAVARTPRLALKGCGFNVVDNFDAMSDVNNTWETQTVTGTANAKGIVHIYIGVMGELSGANYLAPVDPPTLDVYVDGVSYTKN